MQGLDIVPGRVQLLLDARREWVHNCVGEVKALIIVYSRPGVERRIFKIIVSHVRTTHLKVSHNFNTSWLQANSDPNATRAAPFASPWVPKECRNLWSSPIILAASTRTSSCLPIPQPWQRRCDCPRDREANLHDHAGQRRCQQDCGSEPGSRHREEVNLQN